MNYPRFKSSRNSGQAVAIDFS